MLGAELASQIGVLPTAVQPARSRRFLVALAVLLLCGVIVRLPFLPRLGHAYDQNAYRNWMGAIQDHGLVNVFERTDTDYVGYHYILWALGKGYRGDASQVTVRDKELRLWLKLPGLAGDLLTAGLIAFVGRAIAARRLPCLPHRWSRVARVARLSAAETVGLIAAALYLFHPAVLYASSYWGQQDSLTSFFMLLACWLAWRAQPGWAGVVLALGVLVKPQPLVLGPLLAVLVWRRSSWPGLLRGGCAGAAVLLAGHAYFIATGSGERILRIYLFQLTQNEHLSFAAYNLWWPWERLAGARPQTVILNLAGLDLTYGLAATALVLGAVALACWALRRADDLGVLLIAGWYLAAYFLVAAGAHERYVLPAFAFLLPGAVMVPSLRWPLLALSVATTLNLIIGLPLDRRWTQGDPLWLTLVVALVATAAVTGLGWQIIHPMLRRERVLTPAARSCRSWRWQPCARARRGHRRGQTCDRRSAAARRSGRGAWHAARTPG